MPKWTDYTTKTEPADNDEVMVLDTAGKANKRLGLSALSDWIIGKIANKVFENLQTQNKTILGALNELNSNQSKIVSISDVTDIQKTINNITVGTNVLFHLAGAKYTGNDLPEGTRFKYGSGIIFNRNSNSCKIILFPEGLNPVWKMSTWTKWKDFANNIVN